MTKLNQIKNTHASLTKKYRLTENKHKKLNPGSVASFDFRPGNGVGLFWEKGKGWTKKKLDKANKKGRKGKVKKSKRWGSEWTKGRKGERRCPGPIWGNITRHN